MNIEKFFKKFRKNKISKSDLKGAEVKPADPQILETKSNESISSQDASQIKSAEYETHPKKRGTSLSYFFKPLSPRVSIDIAREIIIDSDHNTNKYQSLTNEHIEEQSLETPKARCFLSCC